MVAIYVNLIVNQRRSLDEVPIGIREKVKQELTTNGYIEQFTNE